MLQAMYTDTPSSSPSTSCCLSSSVFARDVDGEVSLVKAAGPGRAQSDGPVDGVMAGSRWCLQKMSHLECEEQRKKKYISGILLKAAQVRQKVNEGGEEKGLKAIGGGNGNDGQLECVRDDRYRGCSAVERELVGGPRRLHT